MLRKENEEKKLVQTSNKNYAWHTFGCASTSALLVVKLYRCFVGWAGLIYYLATALDSLVIPLSVDSAACKARDGAAMSAMQSPLR